MRRVKGQATEKVGRATLRFELDVEEDGDEEEVKSESTIVDPELCFFCFRLASDLSSPAGPRSE